MNENALSLRIDTPVGEIVPGRGFYQLEEDSLYVQVGEFGQQRRFFSYLESEQVRFDIDKQGQLMFIEVACPRRQWRVNFDLKPPSIAEGADIHWLGFRTRIDEPELLTDTRHTILLLQFNESTSWRWYRLAESVLVQADRSNHLTAIFVTEIKDDIAGQGIAMFRRRVCRKFAESTSHSSGTV